VLLRLLADFRRAMDLSLVLDEEGIAHELRSMGREGEGAIERWSILVGEEDAARAESALQAFERENPAAPRAAAAEVPRRDSGVLAGALFALALVALQLWTGPQSDRSEWFARGSADAASIVHGEWWRTVTALTLHADEAHAFGNAVLGGLLLALLARRLGAGLAAWMPLFSGILGTLAAAELLRRNFVSVGASTAVFGALGSLCALQAVDPHGRRAAWIPLGAGLALLGYLGTSRRADLAGHLCGFAAGVLCGLAASRLPRLRSGAGQAALGLLAALVPVAAWLRAFLVI
jgi:membrane associated rhomboid family serine protease